MGEGSGRRKKTKTNHKISRFASLHTGRASVILFVFSAFVVLVSFLLFLLLNIVVSPLTSPFLRLAPASPHRCLILQIRPSSTLSLVVVWVSPIFFPPRILRRVSHRARLTHPHRMGWVFLFVVAGPLSLLLAIQPNGGLSFVPNLRGDCIGSSLGECRR